MARKPRTILNTLDEPETLLERRKSQVMTRLAGHPFRAPWWLRNRHAQTVFGPLCRRPPAVPLRHERWDTADYDFLDLHFCDGGPAQPTVLMLHGLEGCVQSKYLLGLSAFLHNAGWTAVIMEFRGCGSELNRAPRLYHSGETTDLAYVVDRLSRSRGAIYAVGFSLGGNVLAKWLGETGASAASCVRAAAVVSAPYDLTVSGPCIDRMLRGAYARHFLRHLIEKAAHKERQYPGIIDIERVRRSRTLYDFDEHATAVLHGFAGADEYWATQGCGQFLDGIRVPTLLLSSADDPFNPASTLPRAHAEASPYLYPQFTERGGHVGFVTGSSPFQARYWAEDHVMRFFQAYEELLNG